jgi:hypothetical protein
VKITNVRSTTVAIPLSQPLRYAQGVHPGLGVQLDPDKVARYRELYEREGAYAYVGDPRRPSWVPMIPERDWPEPA